MGEAPMRARPRVAVAGASGFVGRALISALAGHAEVVALSRGGGGPAPQGVTWRRCDLFSLSETEAALADVDVAYYLVHSMLPSTRLTQARFEDLDLLLADTFGRAAAACGVGRIVYLGGLVPKGGDPHRLSVHLRSRVETEEALGAYGVPVTAVRAGLVVGAGGSSLRMLTRLVSRLPVMVCPSWTGSRTQPIALEDVVAILLHCLEDDETRGRICEVGGPDIMTYRDMMRTTAQALGKRRWFLPVPLFSPGLSRLWVSLVTDTPRALVAPLIQSLKHPMVAEDLWLQEKMGLAGRPFADAVAAAARTGDLGDPTVRSVQRLPLPAGRDAGWLAAEYPRWLARAFRWVLRVEVDPAGMRIFLRGSRTPLMELSHQPERSGPDRALFLVSGGLLVAPSPGNPRLEFRTTVEGRALSSVHDFCPALPWWLYKITQAPLHALVMWRFGRYLRSRA